MKAAPSLVRRVLLTVLLALLAVYLVVFGIIVYGSLKRESGDLDRTVLRSAQGLARTLDRLDTEEAARAVMAVHRQFTTDPALAEPNNEPPAGLVFARRDGRFRLDSPEVGAFDLSGIEPGISERRDGTRSLRLYAGTAGAWLVVVVDDPARRSRWLVWQVLAELLVYLALTLPIVLLPVWLAVRSGLSPLRRLSDSLAARTPGDLSPIGLPKTYRELQPLQTALNRLFERMAATFAREKAFVHDAAHELRTPLAVISTQAHVLQGSEGAARHEAARRLQGAVARASHLAHQLLRLAQADALALAPRQPVDVMNIARDTLAGMAELAAEHGGELSLSGPDSVVLATDARALRSMLCNLVDNALRYGGRGVLVDVAIEVEAAAWRLRVVDNGPGIAAAHHEQVFERFWRGKAEDERGAGLGLAIVREAARSLGGEVDLQDGPDGHGCRFTVNLPRT